MIFKAYKDRQYEFIKARDIVAFKADCKYVTGVTADGQEWLLEGGITLKCIEVTVSDLIRISRSVLIKRCHILGHVRVRNGMNYAVDVITTAGNYRLSRRYPVQPIIDVIEQNSRKGECPETPPTELPA